MFYKSIVGGIGHKLVQIGIVLILATLFNSRLYGSLYCFLLSDTVQINDPIYDGTKLQPGDTLYLLAGNRSELILKKLVGSEENPIVVTNLGGFVNLAPTMEPMGYRYVPVAISGLVVQVMERISMVS